MKVVILCGGKGTRMREVTQYRPKPLVSVGSHPVIWHIMKYYSHFGFNDFILCTGYKGEMIKDYFLNLKWMNNDISIYMNRDKKIEYLTKIEEDWKVTLIDTGLETLTGGRIKKIQKYIDDDNFMLTYGDVLSNVDINKLLECHYKKAKIATITGINPISPYGVLRIENGIVKGFTEKPISQDFINGGFMVLNKEVFNYFPEKDCFFEQEPLVKLATEEQLAIYHHKDFWTAIDTFKDVERVNAMWNEKNRPWAVWK